MKKNFLHIQLCSLQSLSATHIIIIIIIIYCFLNTGIIVLNSTRINRFLNIDGLIPKS